ncbi:MAG TPA: hypothetical protein VFM19_03620, partial [Candidatus Limnocylindria bacterium]|nr:hypothetical protein [Candidatus Limnocylindria bacterium]
MIRRFGAALIGLALTMPLMALPVTANHGTVLVVTEFSTYVVGGATHVVGTITNNDDSRRTSINVTATFKAGTTVLETQSGPAYLTNLAPHATTPFHIIEPTPLVGHDSTEVTVTSTTTFSGPAGGLELNTVVLDGTTDTLTGNVKNEHATSAGSQVKVFAARLDGANVTDTAASTAVASLAAGASSPFSITFDAASTGSTVLVVAQTTSGTVLLTSWLNYFSDIGASAFPNEIAFMADEAITLGCGPAIYCPTQYVTREQMAAFLVRALGLTRTTTTDWFTDDDGRQLENEINTLRDHGITTGCTSAVLFCPTQTVTREQMAAFIDRGYALPTTTTDFFTDDETSFAEANINRMAAAGITTGCTSPTL